MGLRDYGESWLGRAGSVGSAMNGCSRLYSTRSKYVSGVPQLGGGPADGVVLGVVEADRSACVCD